MARGPAKASSENDVTQPDDESLNFDDDTLKARAEDHKRDGNDAYNKKDFSKAIYFYTEGIKVECKDEELNAKLFNNRATAHFYLENYSASLTDARAAISLQPTYLKAIVRGADACVKLSQFEEAITWCDKGLAIDKVNKKLLELKRRSEVKELTENGEARAKQISGNFSESLNDARAAISLQPTYLKAIVRGAGACVKLSQFKEAITWCDKGLAVSFD